MPESETDEHTNALILAQTANINTQHNLKQLVTHQGGRMTAETRNGLALGLGQGDAAKTAELVEEQANQPTPRVTPPKASPPAIDAKGKQSRERNRSGEQPEGNTRPKPKNNRPKSKAKKSVKPLTAAEAKAKRAEEKRLAEQEACEAGRVAQANVRRRAASRAFARRRLGAVVVGAAASYGMSRARACRADSFGQLGAL